MGMSDVFEEVFSLLTPQRLLGVEPVEQAQIVRRDAHRQHRRPLHQSLPFIGGQDEHPLKLLQLAHAVPRLPPPVVPVGVLDVGIVRPAKGARLRVIATSPGARRLDPTVHASVHAGQRSRGRTRRAIGQRRLKQRQIVVRERCLVATTRRLFRIRHGHAVQYGNAVRRANRAYRGSRLLDLRAVHDGAIPRSHETRPALPWSPCQAAGGRLRNDRKREAGGV